MMDFFDDLLDNTFYCENETDEFSFCGFKNLSLYEIAEKLGYLNSKTEFLLADNED